MPDTSWRDQVGRRVVTPQIIVSALFAGALLFLIVAVLLVQAGMTTPDKGLAQAMNLVLVVFVVADMIARLVVPRLIIARGRQGIAAGTWTPPQGSSPQQVAAFTEFIEKTGDAGRLFSVYLVRTIVAAALVEGVAFFAIIVYLLTESMLGIGLAVALTVAQALQIPTRSGVLHWVEDQLQLVDQERQWKGADAR